MNEFQVEFEIILNAGNAKSLAMSAIECARTYDFDEANSLVNQANEELNLAHHTQTKLLQESVTNLNITPSLLMVHAQDHLSMAMMCVDNAQEMIVIYGLIKGLIDSREKIND